jgi:hypothetical protein
MGVAGAPFVAAAVVEILEDPHCGPQTCSIGREAGGKGTNGGRQTEEWGLLGTKVCTGVRLGSHMIGSLKITPSLLRLN